MTLQRVESVLLLAFLMAGAITQADFSDDCPKACRCKWANGKREADCTNAGFNAVPMHLHHEIQVRLLEEKCVRTYSYELFD